MDVMDRSRGGADESLLVAVRQVMVLVFLLLAVFAACLSRQGSAVHMWLEGSWWLVATLLAVFLTISGILQLFSATHDTTESTAFVLQIIEQVELVAYLLLALGASLARTRQGQRFWIFRTAFWIGTLVLVVLWSITCLLDIMTSERAFPGTVITLTATLVIAVLMLADLCVTYSHGRAVSLHSTGAATEETGALEGYVDQANQRAPFLRRGRLHSEKDEIRPEYVGAHGQPAHLDQETGRYVPIPGAH